MPRLVRNVLLVERWNILLRTRVHSPAMVHRGLQDTSAPEQVDDNCSDSQTGRLEVIPRRNEHIEGRARSSVATFAASP